MAYRWVSKTSTIRLGFEPPLLLSVSKTACPERMQLVLPNSRTSEQSSSEKRICIGSVRAQQALTVTLAQSLTRGTRGTSRAAHPQDQRLQSQVACATPPLTQMRLVLAGCPPHVAALSDLRAPTT